MTATFIQRGGVWVLGQFVLLGLLAAAGFARHGQWHSLPVSISAVLLIVVGSVFGLAGALALRSNLTPYPSPTTRGTLVCGGIYGIVRHPLYTALMCGSFGWALSRQSWPALVVACAIVPFLFAKAKQEERCLRQKFPGYPDYEKRVKRFIPGIY